MPPANPAAQPQDDEGSLTAAADLEIRTYAGYIRTRIPAKKTTSLLNLGRAYMLLRAGIACLVIAVGVAGASAPQASPAILVIVLVALLASLLLIFTAVRSTRGAREEPRRSSSVISAGRPQGQRLVGGGPEKPDLAGGAADVGRKRRPTSYSLQKALRRRRRYRRLG